MVGRTIGKYRIVEQIGRGGMGTVYKALDETLDRTVAIKVLNADLLDQDSVERFRREAVTLARLSHPRIGAIHELTRDGHDLLMVMEFIAGETFEKLIERSSPLAIPDAVRLCAQVLDGLQYAHNAGVVHRDLKPANVIVTPSGDVKIMDFGIARVQGSEHLTSVGFMVGTPAYMSPEQVRGEEASPRMDLYSIAVVLYRMLTQHLPFQGDTAIAMIHSQLSNPPTPARQFRADLPDWIVATLTRGLAKTPADRFQTAMEFKSALEQGLTGKMAIADILGPAHAETLPPTRTPATPMPIPPAAGTGTARVTSTTASPGTSSARQPVPAEKAPSGTLAAAPAPASPPPSSAPEPTVTLRAPHFATAGLLVVVLLVGIGVLAFVALRRPSTPAAPAETTAANNAPAPTESPAAPAPAAPSPAPAAPVAAPADPARPPASDLTRPTPAAEPAARTGDAAPATPPRGRTTPPPAPAPAPVAAAPAAPALPPAANAPAEHFDDLRALVPDGDRGREVEALLALEPGTLVVRGRNGAQLRTMAYQSVMAVTYIHARRPRGQSMAGTVAVPESFGNSSFLSGARHWLTLQTGTEFLVMRLEDRNVIAIMRAVEARTGVKVVRLQD